MNLTPSQFVVIDDKVSHLHAICDALNELGGSCLKINYSTYDDTFIKQNKSIYNGIKVVFSDLHLVPGTGGGDTNAFYSAIVGIIDDIFDEKHPPYLLVLWSEHANEKHKQGLNTYFNTPNLNTKKPIDIICLSKHQFIDTTTGDVIGNPGSLRNKLHESIQSNIGLNALYEWEHEAQKAINETLFELEQLALSQAAASGDSFDNSVVNVLNVFAREAVGKQNINHNPLQALNLALTPIIQDKLVSKQYLSLQEITVNQTKFSNIFWQSNAQDFKKIKIAYSVDSYWRNLISTLKASNIKLSDKKVVGKYNKMLHLSAYYPNSYQSSDLGAISKIENFESIKRLFGFNDNDIISSYFFANWPNTKSETLLNKFLIKISAFCDAAQKKKGSEIFYLVVKVSLSNYLLNQQGSKTLKLAAANIWQSPLFYYDGEDEPFYFFVHTTRFITRPQIPKELHVNFRIKEQLASHLIKFITDHQSRPGIIELK